ncbi:MAG: 23S rRNA (pseudouridine(1915)-N(3))-methyltransferase RlmH [Candidatus Sericytochromatia bacterium]|nr:23S rRNA (pseudouridine(1915)-N(3))-methyltransferase RlmH [Candidatus Sericytochromatia bacterium]
MSGGDGGTLLHWLVAAVGKIRDEGLQRAASVHAARLAGPRGLKIIEVPDVAPRPGQLLAALRREGEALRRATEGTWRMALTERGQAWDTRTLAEHLARQRDQGIKVSFLLGGAEGLDPELEADAEGRLALSRLTFPHELARVILLEQLFRVDSLWRGSPYHRDGLPGERR